MRTFDLKDGTAKLTLDDTGLVTKAGNPFGTWSTNAKNQLVVTKAGGGETTFNVDWRFDANNHLCMEQGGTLLFDFNGDTTSKPEYRLEKARLFIKPLDTMPFQFSILPSFWNLTPQHDLQMTVNGVTSTIDGVINDRNSGFRFRFIDKLDVIETFALSFKGAWKNSPDPARPGQVIYEYEIENAPAPGVFTLPNSLVVDNNSLVLAYEYNKDGRTQSVQLVGLFSFTNFELSFTIERKEAGDGESTTLRFDVDVKGKSAEGKIVFALKRTDNGTVTTDELSVGGAFTSRFKNGVLTIGLAFNQRTINGTVATREIVFTGKLVHKGGTQFAWELKGLNGSMTIGVAASDIRFGKFKADAAVTLKMQGGEVKAVRSLFGVSF
jgi:hypothetical protein